MLNSLKFLSKNSFNNYMDFKNYTCIIKKKIPPANFRTLVHLLFFANTRTFSGPDSQQN